MHCEQEEKARYWKEALEIVLRVLATLPEQPEVRDKVPSYLAKISPCCV